MQRLYDLSAPAKLNLFLHITGRRPDGYHLLQSVFMLIDWCDTLHVDLRADGLISREDLGATLPPDEAGQAALAPRAGGCSGMAHVKMPELAAPSAGLMSTGPSASTRKTCSAAPPSTPEVAKKAVSTSPAT